VNQTAFRLAAIALLVLLIRPVVAEELRLAANEWPPYTFADVYRQGVATALVTAGLERAGYQSRVTIMSWSRVLDTTRRGDNDVIIAAWFTEERDSELAFSEPYLTNEVVFLTRGDVQVRKLSRQALGGYRIGVVEDFAYGEKPYDTAGLDIVIGWTVRDNVRALFARELDLVLGDERILRHEVDLVSGAKFVSFIPEPLDTRGLRIAVSRARGDHADIVAAFNAAISAMREDGSYNSVLANYRVSD